MDEIIVSAPGKIILHGEHAVVYGKAALASSLSLRSYLHLTNRGDDKVSLNLPNVDVYKSWRIDYLASHRDVLRNLDQPVDEIVKEIKKIAEIDPKSKDTRQLAIVAFIYLYLCLGRDSESLPSIDVYVKSSLPVGAGLGSSASYCTCLASSLLLLFGHISEANEETGQWSSPDLQMINDWAFKGEQVIHGNPSGVDNSVATFGGMLKFQGGNIEVLDRMPKLEILLVDTKIPRSTKVLVEKVRDRYNKYPEIMKPVMDSVEAITLKCQETCVKLASSPRTKKETKECYTVLEDLIDFNQSHLSFMGVSHPAIDQICSMCNKKKLHAKLTGAGGGGCVMCLIRPETSTAKKKLIGELKSMEFDCLEATIGGAGVERHFQLPAKFIGKDGDCKEKVEMDGKEQTIGDYKEVEMNGKEESIDDYKEEVEMDGKEETIGDYKEVEMDGNVETIDDYKEEVEMDGEEENYDENSDEDGGENMENYSDDEKPIQTKDEPIQNEQDMMTPVQSIEDSFHKAKRSYKCHICGKILTTRNGQRRHNLKHMEGGKQKTPVQNLEEFFLKAKRSYICHICGKIQNSRSGHRRHHLTHIEGGKYKCEICGKSFVEKQNFQSHLNVHNKLKAHRCIKCQKCYFNLSSLKRHLKVCSGAPAVKSLDWHVCHICGKKFEKKTTLTDHMLGSHDTVGQFPCSQCGKKFRYRTSRSKHMRKKHKKVNISMENF